MNAKTPRGQETNVNTWHGLPAHALETKTWAGSPCHGILSCSLILLVFFTSLAHAQLKPNDRVAICGDSITEQKLYSLLIEDYLLMCKPAPGLHAMQFGWGGETSWGFLARIGSDVLPFSPTVATTCYGMNDAGYSPMTDEKASHYRESMRSIVKEFKKAGVRFIIVGSPGVVDTDFFRRPFNADPKNTAPEAAQMYNQSLLQLRDIAKAVADEQKVGFADVYGTMMSVMPKAKALYGKDYAFAGRDGVHPGPNGHVAMAYAYLKALGCDGDIGTITVDLAQHKATSTDGHKVYEIHGSAYQIESTKYPFCFSGDPASPDSTLGIAHLLPFNQELNRLMLVVNNPGAAKVKITWGQMGKVYTAAELAKGINLAAEFPDNPFGPAFKKVDEAVRNQQNFETPLVKEMMHRLPQFRDMAPGEDASFEKIIASAKKNRERMSDAAIATVTPVKHTIRIETVK